MNRIYLVDAFVGDGALGNPAGVCPLDGPADEQWMRRVALEMNQAETAFIWSEDGKRHIRWFTPAVEVKLCGHATLASCHILTTEGMAQPGETITFQSASGPLICSTSGDGIELDFPAVVAKEAAIPEPIQDQLKDARWFGGNGMDYLALLPSEQAVREFVPDLPAIRKANVRGLIVTAEGTETDIVSRFFAPGAGVDEDHVTGSAHCCLGPFWAQRLGKNEIRAYQASSRGGYITVRVEGDRCHLGGRAVTTVSGELRI